MRERVDEFGMPEELRGELRGLYGAARGMDGRDEGILRAARAAGEGEARRRRYWRMMGAVGMAAAVALAAGMMWRELGRGWQSDATGVPREVAGYVRTGDIRDAFYVAREMKAEAAGRVVPTGFLAAWDTNGDGVVDERDVQVLAMAAVRVTGGEKGVVR